MKYVTGIAVFVTAITLAACGQEAKADETARGGIHNNADTNGTMKSKTNAGGTFSMTFTGTVEQATQLFGSGSTQNMGNAKTKTEDK